MSARTAVGAAAAAARGRVLAALLTLPGLDEERAFQLLTEARAHRHVALHQVDAYLVGHPDALLDGAMDMPVALFRLLRHLADAGLPVTVPVCASCRIRRASLPERDAVGRRICLSCASLRRRKVCSRCREVGKVVIVEAAGPVCERCYARDPAHHEPCASCGRRSRVARRRPDGSAVCRDCHPQPMRVCADCGVEAVARLRTLDGPICGTCYDRNHQHRRERPCGQCGRVAVIKVRARDGCPDLCRRCSGAGRTVCSGCGQDRLCTGHRGERPRCYACRTVATDICTRCDQDLPVAVRWPIGPVCKPCYQWIRSHPAVCPNCSQVRVLFAVDADHRRVCGPCAGDQRSYLCKRCGGGEEIYRRDTCVRCVARQRLTDHLSGEDATMDAAMARVVNALAVARRPRSVLQWLRTPSSSAQLLRSLAQRGHPITHADLDALADRQNVIALRHMLVHVGVLPARHEPLESLPGWLNRFLASVPAEHRSVVRRYALWSVLRRARYRAARGRFTSLSANHTRSKIRVVVALLVWIERENLTLATLAQADIDRWLEDGGIYRIAGFLHWARRHSLIRDVHAPYQHNSRAADHHERGHPVGPAHPVSARYGHAHRRPRCWRPAAALRDPRHPDH